MNAPTARASESRAGWVLVAPALVLLTLFVVWPALAAAGLSVLNWRAPGSAPFVGLDNYRRALTDPEFLRAARNTALFALLAAPLQVGVALGLALLLELPLRGRRFFRTLFFTPVLLSVTVASVIWSYIYRPHGILNVLLASASVPPQRFLLNEAQALPALVVMTSWQNAGFYMVIFTAGLRRVPTELYDAALVDGADGWARLRYVTLPLLRRTSAFVAIAATIYALRLFTEVYILTRGGPAGATRTVVYLIWEEGLRFQDTSYAAALAVLFTLVVTGIALVQRRLLAPERPW